MTTEKPNYEQLFQAAKSAAEAFEIIEKIRDAKNLEKYSMGLLLGLNSKQRDYEKRKAGAGSRYSQLKNRTKIKPRIIREAIRIAGMSNSEVVNELAKIYSSAA